MGSPAGEWCKQCDSETGCRIYDKRPEECRQFLCAYAQMDRAHIDLRPNNCGVIFEKIDDKVFLALIDKELNDVIKRQINYFLKTGFSIITLFKKKLEYLPAKSSSVNALVGILKNRTENLVKALNKK
jgi:hypothetical protein